MRALTISFSLIFAYPPCRNDSPAIVAIGRDYGCEVIRDHAYRPESLFTMLGFGALLVEVMGVSENGDGITETDLVLLLVCGIVRRIDSNSVRLLRLNSTAHP